MKQWLRQWKCFPVLFLLILGCLPAQAVASAVVRPETVASLPDLLAWYEALSGSALQECAVTQSVSCDDEVVLAESTCRVDVVFLEGLRVSDGARLVLDNPNLVITGPPPVLTVEAGGVLELRRWHTLTAESLPQGGIVVKEGGTLVLEDGISLPEGVLQDENPPPDTLPPITPPVTPPDTLPPITPPVTPPETDDAQPETPPPEPVPTASPSEPDDAGSNSGSDAQPPPDIVPPVTPPVTPPPDGANSGANSGTDARPSPTPPPATPPESNSSDGSGAGKPSATPTPTPTPSATPGTTLLLQGAVQKVTDTGLLYARVSIPKVTPTHTQTVTIERSTDGSAWRAEYVFHWDESQLGFLWESPDGTQALVSHDRTDGTKTDFQYLAPLSGAPFYLRVILMGTDGASTVSTAVYLTEPPTGTAPEGDDYEDLDGNRGGGGQGTTDREEQKKPSASAPQSRPPTPPKQPQNPAAAAASPAPESKTDTSSAQSTAQPTPESSEEKTTAPVQASLSGQAKKAPDSSSYRNWIALAVTLVLCAVLWILFKLKS